MTKSDLKYVLNNCEEILKNLECRNYTGIPYDVEAIKKMVSIYLE